MCECQSESEYKYEYQVEYFNENTQKEVIRPYGTSLSTARNHARNMSIYHGVAYVVVTRKRERDGAIMSCGHKAFGNGLVIETLGDGFGKGGVIK